MKNIFFRVVNIFSFVDILFWDFKNNNNLFYMFLLIIKY